MAGRTDGSVEIATPCGSARMRPGQRVVLGWQPLADAGGGTTVPARRRPTEVCFAAVAGARLVLVRIEVSEAGVCIEAGELAAPDLQPAGRLAVWVRGGPGDAEPDRAAAVDGTVLHAHLAVPGPGRPVVVDATWMEHADPAPRSHARPLRAAPWKVLADGPDAGREREAAVFDAGDLPSVWTRARTQWVARLQAA